MNEKSRKEAIDEQYFPYENMTIEERDYYLNLVSLCQDINDSKFKINDESKCRIVEMSFKKREGIISINGSLSIGNDQIRENRCIDGVIFLEKNKIMIDSHITRLCVDDEFKEYTVLDEFTILKNKIKRKSQYNFDMESIYTEMKGKTK